MTVEREIKPIEIMLVEDSPGDAELVLDFLEHSKVKNNIHWVKDGDAAMAFLHRQGEYAGKPMPDLVLLDLNRPGIDGLEVCRLIRRQATTAHLPIIIVSARADEVDRVLGLEMGADDYVVKPFSLKELAARVRVALRRAEGGAETAQQGYRDESFEVEFDAYVVRYKGSEIRLTQKEFEIFRYLVERAGRVLTRGRLLERVWGYESEVGARSIDAHIRRLRLKLGPARDHVETIVGLGYRFVKDPGAPAALAAERDQPNRPQERVEVRPFPRSPLKMAPVRRDVGQPEFPAAALETPDHPSPDGAEPLVPVAEARKRPLQEIDRRVHRLGSAS